MRLFLFPHHIHHILSISIIETTTILMFILLSKDGNIEKVKKITGQCAHWKYVMQWVHDTKILFPNHNTSLSIQKKYQEF